MQKPVRQCTFPLFACKLITPTIQFTQIIGVIAEQKTLLRHFWFDLHSLLLITLPILL